MPYDDKRAKLMSLAMVIVVFYIIFVISVAVLSSIYIPIMEEAGEETAELINSGEAGGSVQIIQDDMASEVRMAFIISLISFGILDGTFVLMLWRRRVTRGHEDVSITLTGMQIVNRFFSTFVIVQLSINVFVGQNPRALMNIIYLTIIISSLTSLALILIIYTKLTESKTKKIAFIIQEEAVG